MPDTAEAVAQYGSAVYRLAYAMTRSRSDAERRGFSPAPPVRSGFCE